MKFSWLAVGLIIILGLIAYANSFSNPFMWDDENLIVTNPYIKNIQLVKNLFTKDLAFGTQFSNFYRPLQSLSFELDYYLWGLNPFGFHLTNLLLHIACALVIYFLFCLIFPAAKSIGLITALLFLVHPIQTEAVTYISGRADPQASLFMLLSIFFYIKHSLKTRPKNRPYLLASVVCFILALLSKETALILPLLILLFELCFLRDSSWYGISNHPIPLRDPSLRSGSSIEVLYPFGAQARSGGRKSLSCPLGYWVIAACLPFY